MAENVLQQTTGEVVIHAFNLHHYGSGEAWSGDDGCWFTRAGEQPSRPATNAAFRGKDRRENRQSSRLASISGLCALDRSHRWRNNQRHFRECHCR